MSDKTNDLHLADELRQMGQQLKELVQAATEHRKTKELEEKITQAVHDLSAQIEGAVRQADASAQGQRVKTAGEEIAKTAQKWSESGAREDLERGLAKSVRALNEQIQRAVEEVRKGAASQE